MSERKLKGVNFRGTLRALERRAGAEGAERVRARVAGEAGEALRCGAIMPNGWYAASWYDALLVAIEDEHPGEQAIVRDLARAAVTEDFSTLFKIISLVATPQMAVANTTRVLQRYVDGGTARLIESREGMLHYVFDGFDGYTARMWEDFVGGMEAVLDLMKVERRQTRVIGAGDGPRCEVILRYQR
ncbi:MAG: hypothetical protein M3Y87_06565 [Myxococcota bacterium]|nr:hypothetical protein [Myxococcota bacterium]